MLASGSPRWPDSQVRAPGAIVVQMHWKHWPCLFPQHGPGRKHQRPIVLEDWQREIVEAHPGAFLRGLFHSDGSPGPQLGDPTRGRRDQALRVPALAVHQRRGDIRELCCWALDLVDIAWRQSNWNCISVSRREAVARLDALIGPKS